jgi:hypothetical protein
MSRPLGRVVAHFSRTLETVPTNGWVPHVSRNCYISQQRRHKDGAGCPTFRAFRKVGLHDSLPRRILDSVSKAWPHHC